MKNLNRYIIKCKKCPRLVKFRNKISKEKRRQFINENYWGKPVTGFGDINGRMLFVGLAPAAHGATRTGRVFTGDKSSDFLYKCLFKAKISNKDKSINLNYGLKLNNAFMSLALKCVPPGDKPNADELNNCSEFFNHEINNLKNLSVIIALGKIAFDACLYFYKRNFNLNKRLIFTHGKIYNLPKGVRLVGCYHPSPRNVNTGRINETKMTNLFKKIKQLN